MKYTLTSTSGRIAGQAKVSYKDGLLQGFAFEFETAMNDVQYRAFLNMLTNSAFKESGVQNFIKIGMKVEQVKVAAIQTEIEDVGGKEVEKKGEETGTNDRIAVFCKAYKDAFGVAYKVQGFEAGKLNQNKGVAITVELMNVYLTSHAWQIEGNYSIMNYIKYQNIILREAAGHKVKPDFVNYYDKRIEDGMDNSKKQLYWAHLRSLGLRPKKLRGKTVGWEKAELKTA